MRFWVTSGLLVSVFLQQSSLPTGGEAGETPFTLVLGIAQDGGAPQAGSRQHPGWEDAAYRHWTACLAIVDPASRQRWLIDATPDFKEQLHLLDQAAPTAASPGLDGIFLTHAHMGHYLGLAHLGHEALGARGIPVFAMPRMGEFLARNGPWGQLVRLGNIELKPLRADAPVELNGRISVTPIPVPHRQEYSEVVAFHVQGPHHSVLYLPDIDGWQEWEEAGVLIEEWLRRVDLAYVDGTFFANGEIPGRDMTGFPHPFISASLQRWQDLPAAEKRKVRFIHLNHTNPALRPDSPQLRHLEDAGFAVARRLERAPL